VIDGCPPDESLEAVTDALLVASRVLVALSARSIAHVDATISISQFRILVLLSNVGAVNLTALARLLDVPRSASGRTVQRLVVAGLIDRRPHPTSPRESVVELTAQGRKAVARVTAHRRGEIARIVGNMSASERRGLVRALRAFAAASGEPALDVDDLL
jgi:DNA-binding MarR family transcriptional regulator